MDIVLACDLGTSSCKLTAVDMEPRPGAEPILGMASRPYPTRHATDGWAEQDPDDWLVAFGLAVVDLQATCALRDLRGLVFTGQMSAALPVDHSGRATHPALIWSDQRAIAETEAAARRISGDAFYRLTGNTLNATYTGPKLAWLKQYRPSAWADTTAFLQPKDWVIGQLTGMQAMDHSDASCTGLYDLAAGAWSPALFELFGLPPNIAPRLVEAATVVGTVQAVPARWLGLPEGLPVVLGGGDGPTSALGTGIGRGEAYLSLGTSAWVSFLHDAPIEDPLRRVFTFRHVLPGLFAVTGSTQNAGNVFGWLGSLLSIDETSEALRGALRSVPPGSDGLLVLPYLQGERTPVWDSLASGAVLGLRSHHGKPHILRAFAEAICFQVALILETFADCGLVSPDIKVVGGLASEPQLLSLMATVTGHHLRRPSTFSHTTSIGAAMLGARALGASPAETARIAASQGETATTPELDRGTLASRYAVYRDLYTALQPILAHVRA